MRGQWEVRTIEVKHDLHPLDTERMTKLLEQRWGSVEEVILRLAWEEGLSRDEIRSLCWDDVSYENGGRLHLPDRSIPLEPGCRRCLQRRQGWTAHLSPTVVISDRRRMPMPSESISRLARNALDSGSFPGVSLGDLRRDFIIRQLKTHDWPYAARVSGIAVSTLHAQFSQYRPEESGRTPATAESAPPMDEFLLWKILQSEGTSPVGLALWMGWRLGMQVGEITELTWDQVDLARGVVCLAHQEVPLGVTLQRLLRKVRESRTPEDDPHVLLTPRSRRPIDQPRLSKIVRTALIRGGLEQVTLGDLSRQEKHNSEDARLLAYAVEHGTICRSEVMELLGGISKVAAYERLKRLVQQGSLVRIGGKYYPADHVVPPEEHYAAIRSYLEENGVAYRQALAQLLRIKPRQCGLILRNMVRSGQLEQVGQQYRLPQPSRQRSLS